VIDLLDVLFKNTALSISANLSFISLISFLVIGFALEVFLQQNFLLLKVV